MSDSSRLTKFSFVLILAVSVTALVVVASQKFGQSRDSNESLLIPTANVGQAATHLPANSHPSEIIGDAPEGPSDQPLARTTIDHDDVRDSLPNDDHARTESDESGQDKDATNTVTDSADVGGDDQASGDDQSPGKKDPRKVLSRQFARRRAAGGAEKEATRVTTEVPEIIHEPRVWLSDDHQKTCLVGVGDPMPEMQLSDGSETVALKEAYGEDFTVVVFWSVANPFAVEQFTHMASDIVHPFPDAKLKAIAIHVGKPQNVYAELCKNFGDDTTCLVDADQANFKKVATRKLPRTYLLDADGKIIWFDIEYSRSTRHELLNAIQYHLQGQKVTPVVEATPDADKQ